MPDGQFQAAAELIVVPVATAFAKPALLMVATLVLLEVHVTALVMSPLEPSL